MSNSDDEQQWVVKLEVLSNLAPTQLAIMVNMFPGVVDARIISSKKAGRPADTPAPQEKA